MAEVVSYKTATDVVFEEAKGRYSRDDATLAINAAPVECGTVVEINGSGNLIPLATAANAAGVILESVPVSTEPTRVVVLSRRAQVKQQALVWPAGYSEANKTAALAALAKLGIVARNGV